MSRAASPFGLSAAREPKRVAVIGAGPVGLVTLAELKRAGHDVVAFETRSHIGGTFTDIYDGLQLTTSNLMTRFGTFTGNGSHGGDEAVLWSRDEYLAYLRGFASHFELLPHIRLGVRLERMRRDPLSRRWRLDVSSTAASSAQPQDPETGDLEFDHVAVCCGSNLRPHMPEWPGMARFRGRLCHSSEIRSEAGFAGKRVLVVGLGESGSDIALMAARVAKASAVSSRNGPGYVIPRHYRGRPSDLDTNRCYHSLPRNVCGAPVVRFKTRIEEMMRHPDEDRSVLRQAEEMNARLGLSPFHRFGTKNTSFLEAIVHHGMTYKPGVAEVDEGRVIFIDGSAFECDVIVCCTGYEAGFPFLEKDEPLLATRAGDPRRLYKRMIDPATGIGITWIGYVRPGIGSVLPCAEMQARLLALLVSGERALPGRIEMESDVRLHADLDMQQFPLDAARIKTLTDYYRFMETMAEDIGCRPPMRKLLLREPRTWLRVLFGPLSSAQYRLAGPGAEPERARRIVRSLPTMPWPVLAYELALWAAYCRFGLRRDAWRPPMHARRSE